MLCAGFPILNLASLITSLFIFSAPVVINLYIHIYV